MGSPGIDIVRRPAGPPVADCLPTWRWRWVNRLRPRFTLPLDDRGSDQLSRFLKALRLRLEAEDVYLLDATLLFDGGKQRPTGYHNDLWFSAPLRNQVLQLWTPLVCEGPPAEVANSMLRIDPEPLEEGWACATGLEELVHLWSGESRPLPFHAPHGVLLADLPRARAGASMEVGETVIFDNRHCHYTLPSQAHRVALAARLCRGLPVYNGYFEQSRPLDGRALSEANRLTIARLFEGVKVDERVPPDHFLYRLDRIPAARRLKTRALRWLLLSDGSRELASSLGNTADAIAASFG